jgi:predicted transcriptional regulator
MTNWDMISYVNASKVRFAILIQLKSKAKTPSQLANSLDIHRSRASSVLKELTGKDLIKCLTPRKRKSRLYIITDSGKEILMKIHELTAVR